MGEGGYRSFITPVIEHRQEKQVEHAASKYVTRGNVGQIVNCGGRNFGKKLSEGGRRSDQNNANPGPSHAFVFGNHVP